MKNYAVSKGVESARLIPLGMGESEPYLMNQKDGKLKEGMLLDQEAIEGLRKEKDRESPSV